jgi:hypothetical protein
MWFDWDQTHGTETRATKNLLEPLRPHRVVDFHNFMFPTGVMAPTVYSQGGLAEEEQALALALQMTWRTRKLRFHDRPPLPFPKPTEKHYEGSWFHQLGADVDRGGERRDAVNRGSGIRAAARRKRLSPARVTRDSVAPAADTLVKRMATQACG